MGIEVVITIIGILIGGSVAIFAVYYPKAPTKSSIEVFV